MSFSFVRRGRSTKAKNNKKRNMISNIENVELPILKYDVSRRVRIKIMANYKLHILHSYDRTPAISFLSAYCPEFWELSIFSTVTFHFR